MIRSPKSPKTSLAAQAVLRRVENERDDALNELRRVTTERDSLRERLKVKNGRKWRRIGGVSHEEMYHCEDNENVF